VSRIVSAHNAGLLAKTTNEQMYAESITNQDLLPVIRITVGNEVCTLNYLETRQHIIRLHETMEAAISDATIARFAKEMFIDKAEDEHIADQMVAGILTTFKTLRTEIAQLIKAEEKLLSKTVEHEGELQEVENLEKLIDNINSGQPETWMEKNPE